jgi:hypothetical protein
MMPGTSAVSVDGGLVLMAEEIKDVILSTGLWLVVRESFGGWGRSVGRGMGGGYKGECVDAVVEIGPFVFPLCFFVTP